MEFGLVSRGWEVPLHPLPLRRLGEGAGAGLASVTYLLHLFFSPPFGVGFGAFRVKEVSSSDERARDKGGAGEPQDDHDSGWVGGSRVEVEARAAGSLLARGAVFPGIRRTAYEVADGEGVLGVVEAWTRARAERGS